MFDHNIFHRFNNTIKAVTVLIKKIIKLRKKKICKKKCQKGSLFPVGEAFHSFFFYFE